MIYRPRPCKALLINCLDPRLQGENIVRIASAAGLKSCEYEVLGYTGPALAFTQPHRATDRDFFTNIIRHISIGVHEISQIVLVGHTDCAGFRLAGRQFADPTTERDGHFNALIQARDAIRRHFRELKTIGVFVTFLDDPPNGLPNIRCEIV